MPLLAPVAKALFTDLGHRSADEALQLLPQAQVHWGRALRADAALLFLAA